MPYFGRGREIMNAKILCLIGVLLMVTTGFAACLPISADSSDSVSSIVSNNNSTSPSSMKIQQGNVALSTSSTGDCDNTYTWHIITLGYNFYIIDDKTGGSNARYHGMYIYNMVTVIPGGTHTILNYAYQSGIKYSYSDTLYILDTASASSCTYWDYTDASGNYYHQNTYKWTDAYGNVFYYAPELKIINDAHHSLQFQNWIETESSSIYEMMAFWKLEWNIQYYAPTSVSYEDTSGNWHSITTSTTGSCLSNNPTWIGEKFYYTGHGNVYATSPGEAGPYGYTIDHYWAALPTPLPVTYFGLGENTGYNLGNYPMGVDYMNARSPVANNYYGTYSDWWTDLHA